MEFRFRAKRLDNNEWCYGYYVPLNDFLRGREADIIYDGSANIQGDIISPSYYKVDGNTLLLSTGFVDKNDKEIFEGDILRSDVYPYSSQAENEYDNYYALIVFDDESQSLMLQTCKNPNSYVRGISDGLCDILVQDLLNNFEIIGNTVDNDIL